MTQALATMDQGEIEQIRKMVSTGRNPITTDQFSLFLNVCRLTGLNPLLKDIYATEIDGRFTILTSIDGYRKTAQNTGHYRGQTSPEWCAEDGVWTTVWTKAEPPWACRVGVYMAGRAEPTWGIAYYKNYRTKNTPTWKSMPEHMLSIRAEAFALRKCFNRELGMVQVADDTPDAPRAEVYTPPQQALAEPAYTDVPAEEPPEVPPASAGPNTDTTPPPADPKPLTPREEALALRDRLKALGIDAGRPATTATMTAAQKDEAYRAWIAEWTPHLIPADAEDDAEFTTEPML